MIPPWNSDMSKAPADGSRLLLTVLVKGKRQTVIGGYDSSWSGKCWSYDHVGVPRETVPVAWTFLPYPMMALAHD